MRTLTASALLLILCFMFCVGFLMLGESGSLGSQGRDPLPQAEDLNAVSAVPGIVRIILQESPASSGGLGLEDQEKPKSSIYGDFEHRGALDVDFMKSLVETIETGILVREQEELRAIKDPNSLAFAKAMLSIAQWDCALDALKAGDYIATPEGAKGPGMSVPGAEVVTTGGFVGGEPVTLTLILLHEKYPGLKRARDQFDVMSNLDDWMRSARFNALPEEERRTTAEKIARLYQKPDLSPAELNYIHETIGFDVSLDPRSATVIVRPLSPGR